MNKELTGYPSIDKPWLKYYREEAINANLPSKTMYQFIYDNNKDRLDNIAICYFDKKITYKDFFNNTIKTAKAFCARGIKEGDIVTIVSLNTPETVYAIYALNYIGATANLLGAAITAQEIQENIAKTNSKLVLILDKLYEKIGAFNCTVPLVLLHVEDSAGVTTKFLMKLTSKKNKNYESFWDFIKLDCNVELKSAHSDSIPAIIVYTSGTTGTPKGVVLSSRNLNAVALQCSVSGKEYKPNESFLNILPPFISFGIGMLHLCFYSGMTEIVSIIPKAEIVMKYLKKYRPERFVIGPALTEVIENYRGNDLSFLVDLTGGGGGISLEKERQLNRILKDKSSGSKYLSGYGMTELSSAVSMNHNNIYKEQSIGIPLSMTNVKVIDNESGDELTYGNAGELLVNSPGLMLGYYDNSEETETVIEYDAYGERWIHTGDLAKIDEDGFVFITGRIKRIYITKHNSIAYKLFPQRMEELIEKIPQVMKCGVIVSMDDERGNVPIVFVTLNSAESNKEIKTQILMTIEENLPPYYCPKDVVVLDDMPITTSQKIDYRALEREAETL